MNFPAKMPIFGGRRGRNGSKLKTELKIPPGMFIEMIRVYAALRLVILSTGVVHLDTILAYGGAHLVGLHPISPIGCPCN